MIDFTEIKDSYDWELFSRDFLEKMGFCIESEPNKGQDGGMDILVSEHIKGKLDTSKIFWLVSCKHNAKSNKSVNEDDERNITDRVKSFNADGFLGIYSTMISSGLHHRLETLKKTNSLNKYKIFDNKKIENYLFQIGYSNIFYRYFPNSYKNIAPINIVFDKYIPLNCEYCGTDVLKKMYEHESVAILAWFENDKHVIYDIYVCCLGECDDKLRLKKRALYKDREMWVHIEHWTNPLLFVRKLFSQIISLNNKNFSYTDEALNKFWGIVSSLSQKVLRETSKSEHEKYKKYAEYGLQQGGF